MDSEFRRVKELFLAALEKTNSAERAAFVSQACGADAALRDRVEALLRREAEAAGFLEPPAVSERATSVVEGPGAQIGPYRLVEQIGEGGFGVVFLAEQQQPVRRKVALKILKPGLDSRQVVARFEAEKQALALMDHANIARVLDGGESASGRPYFVMELVQGTPITKYCDENHQTPRQRLALFVTVCQAIQHAHQKGIIHRDLKPTNILVAADDAGRPVPKVIDFGVAKAMGQPLTERTLSTGIGAIIGTLEYMSPEQAEFNARDVDTRADVYSLGVLLYELLTGTTPLTKQRVRDAALTEVLRLVREEEPPKPSSRLAESRESLAAISALRKVEPSRLAKEVRGELDWIAMKALEKDRNRRFETANALARDIERYLNDEPVEAGPPSAIYRIRKLARKNRGLLAAAAAFMLMFSAGAGVSVWQAVRARDAEKDALTARDHEADARTTAERSEQEMRSVLDFVTARVFAAPRPKGRDGGVAPDITLRGALEAAIPFVQTNFANQPLVEARLRETIGISFWNLGEGQLGADQLEAARGLYVQHRASDHADTLRCMMALARCYDLLGQNQKSLDLTEQVLAVRTAALGRDDPATLRTMNNVAAAYVSLHRMSDAVKLFEEALPLLNSRLGHDHPHTLACRANLASCYLTMKQTAQATRITEETLRLMKAKVGSNDRDALTTMTILAKCYESAARHDEALKLRLEALALRRASLGVKHPDTLTSIYEVARGYEALGRDAEALPLYQEALALRKAKLGYRHADTMWNAWYAVNLLVKLDRAADAIPIIDECVRESIGCAAGDHMRPALLDFRLRHFEKVKDRAGCLATAELCEKFQVADAESFYNAARYRAVAAAVTRLAGNSPDAAKLADAQAEHSMAWLHKAIAAGFNAGTKLKDEKDFHDLHSRPDFQQMLLTLSAGK